MCKSTYFIEYSEDKQYIFLVRTKKPRWRMVLNKDEFDADKLAASLRKAAEFLTKRVKHDSKE